MSKIPASGGSFAGPVIAEQDLFSGGIAYFGGGDIRLNHEGADSGRLIDFWENNPGQGESEYGLEQVLALRLVSFLRNPETCTDGVPCERRHLGFIAQEVKPTVLEVVEAPAEEDDFYSVAYSEHVAVLVKAVQEQQTQIDAQQFGAAIHSPSRHSAQWVRCDSHRGTLSRLAGAFRSCSEPSQTNPRFTLRIRRPLMPRGGSFVHLPANLADPLVSAKTSPTNPLRLPPKETKFIITRVQRPPVCPGIPSIPPPLLPSPHGNPIPSE